MTDAVNWTCPHCDRPQTVVGSKRFNQWIELAQSHGDLKLVSVNLSSVECANTLCKKITFHCSIYPGKEGKILGSMVPDIAAGPIFSQRLIPESSAKPQPDFIPRPIREDYVEACRIVDGSPKSSATLARRCLQGMIRDFCDISKRTLWDDLEELSRRVAEGSAPPGVTIEAVEAIDHVRRIGKYGAHMEKDIDVIIEIEPGEASALIGLIEMLFKEWYIARKTRRNQLAQIKDIAETKDAEARNGQSGAEERAGEA